MQSRMAKRLQKDLEQMQKSYVDQFNVRMPNNDIKHWIVAFEGAKELCIKERNSNCNSSFQTNMQKYLYLFSSFFFEISLLNLLKQSLLANLLSMNIFIPMDLFAYQYYSMSGQPPSLQVLFACLYNQCYQVQQKDETPNDAEFVKRAAGRGPKSFLWSYHDEKC